MGPSLSLLSFVYTLKSNDLAYPEALGCYCQECTVNLRLGSLLFTAVVWGFLSSMAEIGKMTLLSLLYSVCPNIVFFEAICGCMGG